MLKYHLPSPTEKRKQFKAALRGQALALRGQAPALKGTAPGLKRPKIMRFVGSFSPLVSRMIEESGFEGVYVSGAVLSSDLTFPDLELTGLSEAAGRGGDIIRASALPALADADTGFGSLWSLARGVKELEQAGFCGLHLEDQQSPKKCGHLENKKLISVPQMCTKINTLLKARTDPNFLIIARTDARGVEGFRSAVQRAKAYQSAGAEAVFPEALETKKEFEQFRQAVKGPLIANVTEFGKSPLLSAHELESMGYNMALYPVTTWRLALKAAAVGLTYLSQKKRSQKKLLDKMLPRQELYNLLKYSEYDPSLKKRSTYKK